MADYVDCYPKRPLFKVWVADAKQKLNARNNAEVAERVMKVQPTTLNKWLGKSPTHKPSPEALKLLGDFLERDYRLLLDDPETAPLGVSPDQWASASERTRVLASAMFQDLLALPEEEQQLYYELWKKGQEIGRQRLAAEAMARQFCLSQAYRAWAFRSSRKTYVFSISHPAKFFFDSPLRPDRRDRY